MVTKLALSGWHHLEVIAMLTWADREYLRLSTETRHDQQVESLRILFIAPILNRHLTSRRKTRKPAKAYIERVTQ
jgi:hypothetical protein